MKTFAVCRCIYKKNIYLEELNAHIDFTDRSIFLKVYDKILQSSGYTDEVKQSQLINKIEKEIERRQRLQKESLHRKTIIEQNYERLYPQLPELKEEYLSPTFLDLVNYCKDDEATFEGVFDQPLTQTDISRAYLLPVFTPSFCQQLLEEVVQFEQSDCPKGRPNTMNNYGVLLDELGFDDFVTSLREHYLRPITTLLYPDWGGAKLDSHKAFIVKYQVDEDLDLNYHFDDAEVTLNIALSAEGTFTGGDLYFGAMRTENDYSNQRRQFQHVPYTGLLHRGQHCHGAMPIQTGTRYNLIIWMRASIVRNNKCPMCDCKPDLESGTGFGAGFTMEEVNVCTMV